MPDLPHLLVAGLVLGLAGVLQGAVGFGFALFATPLLALAGVPLPQAVAAVATAGLVQIGTSAVKLRREVPWRTVLPAAAIRLAALPVGIGLLLLLSGLEPARVQQTLGLLVLLALGTQLAARRALGVAPARPPRPPRRRWTVLAFGASGLMQGLAGMGGPAAVLWTMTRDWDSRRSRGFLAGLMLLGAPAQLALLLLASPGSAPAALGGAAAAPIVLAGSLLGVALGDRLGRTGLRRVALSLLGASAGTALLGPLLS